MSPRLQGQISAQIEGAIWCGNVGAIVWEM